MGALGPPSGILGLHYTATAVDRRATITVGVPQDKLDRLLLNIDDACRHLNSTATVRMLLRIIGQVSFALFARPVRAEMALLDRSSGSSHILLHSTLRPFCLNLVGQPPSAPSQACERSQQSS